jgi:hypothetical protein
MAVENYGSSLFQMGEYFEILAARVDPGRR